MRAKGISLEQLTSKVLLIQRAWRKALTKVVVHKYRVLFRQATDKLARDHNPHDISVFAESLSSELNTTNRKQKELAAPVFFPFLKEAGRSRGSSQGESPLKWSEEGRRPHLDLASYQ